MGVCVGQEEVGWGVVQLNNSIEREENRENINSAKMETLKEKGGCSACNVGQYIKKKFHIAVDGNSRAVSP